MFLLLFFSPSIIILLGSFFFVNRKIVTAVHFSDQKWFSRIAIWVKFLLFPSHVLFIVPYFFLVDFLEFSWYTNVYMQNSKISKAVIANSARKFHSNFLHEACSFVLLKLFLIIFYIWSSFILWSSLIITLSWISYFSE